MALRLTNREDMGDKRYSFAAFVKDAHSAQEIERLFRSDTLLDTYVASGGVGATIAWLQKQERSPLNLLVDISGEERPLDVLDRLADACEPSVQVYVVGDRNDVGLYRNLLSRGIRDYLVKPLSLELLRRSTSQQAQAAAQRGIYPRFYAPSG